MVRETAFNNNIQGLYLSLNISTISLKPFTDILVGNDYQQVPKAFVQTIYDKIKSKHLNKSMEGLM